MSSRLDSLREVIGDHIDSSPRYVEARDWLYVEPEVLLIAERSVSRPEMLRATLEGTDYETVVMPMIAEWRSRLG